MATKDNKSQNIIALSAAAAISSDTTTNFASIDTKDIDNGLTLGLYISAWTDGTYAVQVQESVDDSVWTDVDASNIIGTAISEGAAYVADADLPTVGVIGTERYVRAQVDSTSTSTGATMAIVALKSPETVPA